MALSCIDRTKGKEKVFLNYNFELELGWHFHVFVGEKEKKKISSIIFYNE